MQVVRFQIRREIEPNTVFKADNARRCLCFGLKPRQEHEDYIRVPEMWNAFEERKMKLLNLFNKEKSSYILTEKDKRWNNFIDNVYPGNLSTLSAIQRKAVTKKLPIIVYLIKLEYFFSKSSSLKKTINGENK